MVEENFKRIEKDAVKSWIIGRLIFDIIALPIIWGVGTWGLNKLENIRFVYFGLMIILICLTVFLLTNLLIFPFIEYSQWRYKITNDKVMLKNGIFIKNEVTIPISRIQNINITYGPIFKRFGLVSLEIVTAGGCHDIPAIKKEEGRVLVENLKTLIEEGGRFES